MGKNADTDVDLPFCMNCAGSSFTGEPPKPCEVCTGTGLENPTPDQLAERLRQVQGEALFLRTAVDRELTLQWPPSFAWPFLAALVNDTRLSPKYHRVVAASYIAAAQLTEDDRVRHRVEREARTKGGRKKKEPTTT